MDIDGLRRLEQRCLWHPFTPMQEWEAEEPLFIEGGEGIKLRDVEGREYYDANSSLWVNLHGHRREEIDAAVAAQLGRMAHSTMLGLTHAPGAELAGRLVGLAPVGLTRVFYSDSGSEAVEIALKMAYQYWLQTGSEPRTRYIALADGYHGDTVGAVSVGGIPLFHGIFRKLLFTVDFAPCPARSRNAEEAAYGLERLLKEHAGQVAAVIVEPLIQAAGGMLLAPPGYLRQVRDLCRRYETLLIVDEVATGFGRTGRMFACEHEGVSPDLMCLAKGLTGGYLPLAATLATEEIYRAFLGEGRTFYHGHSYTGNPLACAAALASLEIFERERMIESLPPKIEAVRLALLPFQELAHVREVRQCGLMVGIELSPISDFGFRISDLGNDRSDPRPKSEIRNPKSEIGKRVCRRARLLGLITRPLGDVVVFLPPLASTEEELRAMLAILYEAIEMETR